MKKTWRNHILSGENFLNINKFKKWPVQDFFLLMFLHHSWSCRYRALPWIFKVFNDENLKQIGGTKVNNGGSQTLMRQFSFRSWFWGRTRLRIYKVLVATSLKNWSSSESSARRGQVATTPFCFSRGIEYWQVRRSDLRRIVHKSTL